jgi:hypothetical protein
MTDFAEFRDKALEKQPLLYDTNLSNIRVGSSREVEVDGKTLPLGNGGFDDLRAIAGVNKQTARNADKYMGEDASAQLVENMRNGLSDQNDEAVAVAIDRSENEVVGVNEDVGQMISMEGFFELAERILDKYDLEIEETTIGHDGAVNLSMKNPNRVVNLDGFGALLDDEAFNTGISMSGRLGQVDFESFMYRLICTNGIIGEFWGDNLEINSLDSEDVFEFFDHVDRIADNHFLPEDFGDSVSRAAESYASLRELEDVHSSVARHFEGEDERQVERFAPLRRVYSEYRNEGIEPTELTQRQKRNAVTDVKLWDAINGLTRFASHDQTGKGFNVSDRQQTSMMRKAGSLLERNRFDMENLVPVPDSWSLN